MPEIPALQWERSKHSGKIYLQKSLKNRCFSLSSSFSDPLAGTKLHSACLSAYVPLMLLWRPPSEQGNEKKFILCISAGFMVEPKLCLCWLHTYMCWASVVVPGCTLARWQAPTKASPSFSFTAGQVRKNLPKDSWVTGREGSLTNYSHKQKRLNLWKLIELTTNQNQSGIRRSKSNLKNTFSPPLPPSWA